MIKKKYWRLLNIAKKYSNANGTERVKLVDLDSGILKTKDTIFAYAQILFSIGTFAYSLLFFVYGVIPLFIGWFGIIASIFYGFGNLIFRIKPESKSLWNLGGLLILIFEMILGGCLLFYSFTI